MYESFSTRAIPKLTSDCHLPENDQPYRHGVSRKQLMQRELSSNVAAVYQASSVLCRCHLSWSFQLLLPPAVRFDLVVDEGGHGRVSQVINKFVRTLRHFTISELSEDFLEVSRTSLLHVITSAWELLELQDSKVPKFSSCEPLTWHNS